MPSPPRCATVGFNQALYFAVGKGDPVARRQVVSQATCTDCHEKMMLHGGIRQNVEYCVVCHNPTVTDSGVRKANDTPESTNFKTLIHKIHTGSDLTTDSVIVHGASVNNYNDVGYVGDRRDCAACHLPAHPRQASSFRSEAEPRSNLEKADSASSQADAEP